MSPRVILPLLLLTQTGCGLSFRSKADSLEYEVYALHDSKGRELLAKGTVKSDGHNVQSVDRSAFGMPVWDKSVQLSQGYVVGASVFREKELKGFGLWIGNKDGGFSWDWFVKEDGLAFRKLQGEGHVRASLIPNKDYEELAAVEFLDDVTLRGNFGWFPFLEETHHIIIKKDSVLRLVP